MSGISVGQISVRVHDLERAVAFYRDVLGFAFQFQVPSMAFFQCGETRLMLALPSDPRFDHPSSIIYYRVPNLDARHRHLVEHHVPVEGAPHKVADLGTQQVWMAFYRDPDENVFALMEERDVAPSKP